MPELLPTEPTDSAVEMPAQKVNPWASVPCEKLLAAIDAGDEALAEGLLKEYVFAEPFTDANYQSFTLGSGPLHRAAQRGLQEVIFHLSEQTDSTVLNPNCRYKNADNVEMTALGFAISNDHQYTARTILELYDEALIEPEHPGVMPSYLMAVKKGQKIVVEAYIKHGFFYEADEVCPLDPFVKAVRLALSCKQKEIVKILKKHNPEIYSQITQNYSIAISLKSRELVEVAKMAGAPVNPRGGKVDLKSTPIAQAIIARSEPIIRDLLAAGAKTHLFDSSSGVSLLHIAASYGTTSIYDLFAHEGIPYNAVCSKSRHTIQATSCFGDIKLSTLSHHVGAFWDNRTKQEVPLYPLDHAFVSSNLPVIQYCLANSQPYNLKTAAELPQYDLMLLLAGHDSERECFEIRPSLKHFVNSTDHWHISGLISQLKPSLKKLSQSLFKSKHLRTGLPSVGESEYYNFYRLFYKRPPLLKFLIFGRMVQKSTHHYRDDEAEAVLKLRALIFQIGEANQLSGSDVTIIFELLIQDVLLTNRQMFIKWFTDEPIDSLRTLVEEFERVLGPKHFATIFGFDLGEEILDRFAELTYAHDEDCPLLSHKLVNFLQAFAALDRSYTELNGCTAPLCFREDTFKAVFDYEAFAKGLHQSIKTGTFDPSVFVSRLRTVLEPHGPKQSKMVEDEFGVRTVWDPQHHREVVEEFTEALKALRQPAEKLTVAASDTPKSPKSAAPMTFALDSASGSPGANEGVKARTSTSEQLLAEKPLAETEGGAAVVPVSEGYARTEGGAAAGPGLWYRLK